MKFFIKYQGYWLKSNFYKDPQCWTNNQNSAGTFTAFEVQLIKDRFFNNTDIQIIQDTTALELLKVAETLNLEETNA